jgi:D-erythritol 1-phosphate dehydrogenase
MPAALNVDLLVVGGGIHGAGIARDAAGRGLRVLLVEQGDLAGATSSASSKLAHGGLRYLELGDFRLVREALCERDTLMRIAPHLVGPLPFFLPRSPSTRPAWQIRAGLLLYDWLAGRSLLPRSRALDLSSAAEGEILKPECRSGHRYYDGWADDARLVVANAMDAAARGALVMTRTRCVRAVPAQSGWSAQLVCRDAPAIEATAHAIVNATGPWVERFLRHCTAVRAAVAARLVKGSHIVVRRTLPSGQALVLPNDDGRIVFVIPFEGEFALIGTTDVALSQDPDGVAISQEEVDYLRAAVNRFLAQPVAEQEIVWTYSGVRALHDDGSANPSRVTREYLLHVDHADNHAPILSVYGGKLTTYRRVAEEAVGKLNEVFPGLRPAWTAQARLPGGDLGGMSMQSFGAALRARYPELPGDWLAGIARRHGALADALLGNARQPQELGMHFGAGLTACEVEYLAQHEWAREADDVLWRRTKAGLHLSDLQREAVARHLHQLGEDGKPLRQA